MLYSEMRETHSFLRIMIGIEKEMMTLNDIPVPHPTAEAGLKTD